MGLSARSAALGILGVTACGDLDYLIVVKVPENQGATTGTPLSFDEIVRPDTGRPTCEEAQLTERVTVDESCAHGWGSGEMEVAVEWSVDSFQHYPEYDQILVVPVVGRLSGDDVPDIVVITDDDAEEGSVDTHGVLRVLSGDDGEELLTIAQIEEEDRQIKPYRYGSVALGDINADGEPDIALVVEVITPPEGELPGDDKPKDDPVGPPPPASPPKDTADPPEDTYCHLAAFSANGELLWLQELELECGAHSPALADLEGDGDVEVVLGSLIVEGATGALVAQGALGTGRFDAYEEIGFQTVIADLDGDGIAEVVAGNTLYGPTGEVRCTLAEADSDGFPAVADLDGDGRAEFVVVGNGTVRVADADCQTQHTWTLDGEGNGGPPTIADFDADGGPEIGVASDLWYAVYDPDGALLWSAPTTDGSSHATGSSVFDFEGDGQPEVLYGDEETFWIFDGATGEVRYADTSHASRTVHEYPTVADVDNDGEPEIVLTHGGGHGDVPAVGLKVLGSAGDPWVGGRPVWNQHAYSITNIEDDLSIPTQPDPNWLQYNNFRSGDLYGLSEGAVPDAVPVGEVCMTECARGRVVLTARVGNQGMKALPAGVGIGVYSLDGAESVLLDTQHTEDEIAAGETSESLVFEIATPDVGADGLMIRVDDDAAVLVRECDEGNNVVILEDVGCQ